MNALLTDTEYDRLGSVLSRFHSQRAMNLEKLDGFFAALICCPDTVLPSEYLAEIWGGDMADEDAFATQQELQDFLNLVMRHCNGITHTLHSGDVFLPLLLEDEQGVAHANDWAQGFMRGVALRNEDWLASFDLPTLMPLNCRLKMAGKRKPADCKFSSKCYTCFQNFVTYLRTKV